MNLIITSDNGKLAIDDTVLDKGSSAKIETAAKQYSGQKHGITTGIGVVTLVYINPELGKYWIINYRMYDKATDSKKKTEQGEHLRKYGVTVCIADLPKVASNATISALPSLFGASLMSWLNR